MSGNSTEKSGNKESNFGWLVICFVMLLISLPAFYFGSRMGKEGQGMVLLICGFIFLCIGMIISIVIKT